MSEAELLNKLNKLIRKRFGDNAVEALIGIISTLVTENQLKVLVLTLTEQELNE